MTTSFSSANFAPQERTSGCVLHRLALRTLPSEPGCPCLRKSRSADRRRTLRGWHLPSTRNRCIPTNSRIPSLAGLHVEGAPLVWPGHAKHVNARNDRAGPRTWAEIRLATYPVLGRSAVDAASRASEPTPRNSHRLPLSRAGAASRCRAWIVPKGTTTESNSSGAYRSHERPMRGAHRPPTQPMRSGLVKGTPRGLDLGT